MRQHLIQKDAVFQNVSGRGPAGVFSVDVSTHSHTHTQSNNKQEGYMQIKREYN